MPSSRPAGATCAAWTPRSAAWLIGSPPGPDGGRWAVATYADRGGTELFARPGLSRLLSDAASRAFDVVVIDSAFCLGWEARARQELAGRLAVSGVRVEVIGGSRLGRVTGLVADLVLADLIGEAVR
jgi:hypothetical protein